MAERTVASAATEYRFLEPNEYSEATVAAVEFGVTDHPRSTDDPGATVATDFP